MPKLVLALLIVVVSLAAIIAVAKLLREHFILLVIAGLGCRIWADMQNSTMHQASIILTGLIIILFLLYLVLLQQRKRATFEDWLKQNRTELKYGPVDFDGHKLSLDSVTTQYTACVSVMTTSIRFRSR